MSPNIALTNFVYVMKKISYKEFQSKVYASLIKYKHDELGIKEKGFSTKKVAHDCLFPDSYWPSNIPMMLYKNIIDIVKDIQECPYSYKPHIAAQRHVASSQTACLNLFIPILESDHADCIIKESGVAPVDFDHIDRTLYEEDIALNIGNPRLQETKVFLVIIHLTLEQTLMLLYVM